MKYKKLNAEKDILKIIRAKKRASVNELIEKASTLGLDKWTIVISLIKLWKKGYIDIRDENIRGFKDYIFGIEGLWYWIILSLIIGTFILVLQTPPQLIALRYVLGSIYVLYLPGYTLIEALYPRPEELEPLERLALSIGLSLALVPLVGLILNYTPWGIRLEPITISLAILTLILSTIAIYRKYTYFKLQITKTS